MGSILTAILVLSGLVLVHELGTSSPRGGSASAS